jgi:hypothetical protein
VAGQRRTDLALRELGHLASALEQRPGPARRAFLESSYARQREPPAEAHAPWWPALLPALPPGVLAETTSLLRARPDAGARTLLGMLLARNESYDAALDEFGTSSAAGDQPLLALALRALALWRTERPAEARAELARLGELLRSSPRTEPGLEELLADVRGVIGP